MNISPQEASRYLRKHGQHAEADLIQREHRGTKIERDFSDWATRNGITDLHQQVRLIHGRKLQWDFVHFPSRTAIETQGSNWGKTVKIGGRLYIPMTDHNTIGKITSDAAKAVLAQLCGYFSWQLAGESLKDAEHMSLLLARLRGEPTSVREGIVMQPERLF